MFAGKSSHILSLVSRHVAVGMRVLVIKHATDTRYAYSEDNIVTHDQRRATCSSVVDLHQSQLHERIRDHQVILVDEAQFFQGLIPFVKVVVETLGKKLYLVGLDGDSNRDSFGELLRCIPLADRVEKLTSFCQECADGTAGLFTHRKNGPRDQQVIIGDTDMYTTLCRRCYLRYLVE